MGGKTSQRHHQRLAAEVGEAFTGRGRRVAVVYPGPYAVAMANLGYQWLFRALDRAGLRVSRVLWPDPDIMAEAEREGLLCLDDNQPAARAEIWFVSISYENDLVRLAGLLRLAGLPPRAADRATDAARGPLIVAGGVAPSLNPEPVSLLADVCLPGEGQAALDPFLAYLAEHDPADREAFLAGLAEVPNAYVGRYYRSTFAENGRLARLEATGGFPERLQLPKEATVDPLCTCTHRRAPEAAFGDALLVETGRGCVTRCRFCAAGHLFLPYRPAAVPPVLPNLAQEALGLVGANVSGHPQLDAWLDLAEERRVTLSSIRLGLLDEDRWRRLAAGRLASVALAPEAGSERLRRTINKPVSEATILAELERAVGLGIRNVKLYFLMGLPTETDDDREAMVELIRRCREAAMAGWKRRGRAGRLTVSLNPFVPKPHTPFQWCAFADPADLRRWARAIGEKLRRVPNVVLQTESLREATLQAILSTGDRRAGELAIAADALGINAALKKWPNGPVMRAIGEPLPWDCVDPGVRQSFLENEYRAGLAGKVTPPCEIGKSQGHGTNAGSRISSACTRCGACGPRQ